MTIRYEDSPRLFGALVVPQRAAVLASVGADAFTRGLTRLPRDVREEYEELRDDAWCRSDTVERAILEVARAAAVDARELTASTVRVAIVGTVGKLWHALLVMTSDDSLINRTPMFYARSYDRGSLTAHRIAPGRAELVLEGWPEVPELHMVGIAEAVRAVLELAGRADVSAAARRDEDRARFDVTWRV